MPDPQVPEAAVERGKDTLEDEMADVLAGFHEDIIDAIVRAVAKGLLGLGGEYHDGTPAVERMDDAAERFEDEHPPPILVSQMETWRQRKMQAALDALLGES